MTQAQAVPHTPIEDVFALLTGVLLVGVGVEALRAAGLVSGGTAGLALLIHSAAGLPLAQTLFVVNLPFYAFAYWRLGLKFTLRTILAVTLLTATAYMLPSWLGIARITPWFAAVLAGLLIGVGLLILIRHRSTLGGVGIVAVYVQERFGISAGKVQLAIDCAILSGAFLVIDPIKAGLSVLGAVVLNTVLWLNHRDGRYMGY